MNMLASITTPNTRTMSSREIADIAEARHNDLVATIDRLFDKGLLRSSRKTRHENTGGRPIEVYDLVERDVYLNNSCFCLCFCTTHASVTRQSLRGHHLSRQHVKVLAALLFVCYTVSSRLKNCVNKTLHF